MKIQFTLSEQRLLKRAGISVQTEMDCNEDQAMDLLSAIHDAEVSFARSAEKSDFAAEQAERYADIADRLFSLIPD